MIVILKILSLFLILIRHSNCLISTEVESKPANYINPLINTHKSPYDYFTSASVPIGMVSLSPDTPHSKHKSAWVAYENHGIILVSRVLSFSKVEILKLNWGI